jgi:cytochrome c oxidase subunit I+III
MRFSLFAAIPLAAGGVAAQFYGDWQAGLSPETHSYGAVLYAFASWQGFFTAVLAVMALYTAARSLCGKLNHVRRGTFDNTALLWHYTTAQGLVTLAVVTFFPRLIE